MGITSLGKSISVTETQETYGKPSTVGKQVAGVGRVPFNDSRGDPELRCLTFGSFLTFSQMRSLETCSNSALSPLSIDTSPEM